MTALALLASCSNGETPTLPNDAKVPLQINDATVNVVQTRAQYIQTIGTKLGVIIDGEGYTRTHYVYEFNKFSAPGVINPATGVQRWDASTTENIAYLNGDAKLSAYLPANIATVSNEVDPALLTGRNIAFRATEYTENVYDATSRDFCVVKDKTVNSVSNSVTLTLDHVLSVLDFQFQKTETFNVSPGNISAITFAGKGLYDERYYSLDNLTWGARSTVNGGEMLKIYPTNKYITIPNFNTTQLRIQALVVPATLTVGENYTLNVTMDEVQYRLNIPYSMIKGDIEANKRYVFKILFDGKQAVVNSITQEDWTVVNVNDGKPYVPQFTVNT